MKIQHWKVIAAGLMVYDLIAVVFSYFFGLWLRFDFHFTMIPTEYLHAYTVFIPFYSISVILFFWFMRMYRSVWRFAGFHELLRYGCASLIASAVHTIVITLAARRMPVSYYIVGSVSQLILVVGIRFSYRFYTQVLEKKSSVADARPARKAMIIGAGAAGRTVVRELQQSDKTNLKPACFIDDNPNKWGRYIEGVPVVGGRDDIPNMVVKYGIEEIHFCIPTASAQVRKEILDICKETGCKLMSLPGLYQLANEEVSVSKLKSVAVEDLLGREPIKVDMGEIFRYIRGKTILVTGAGGSIGSELCRQIAAHEPKQLILFDIYENTTYLVERELRKNHPDLDLHVLIGSVRDSRRVNQIFELYHPELVFRKRLNFGR